MKTVYQSIYTKRFKDGILALAKKKGIEVERCLEEIITAIWLYVLIVDNHDGDEYITEGDPGIYLPEDLKLNSN